MKLLVLLTVSLVVVFDAGCGTQGDRTTSKIQDLKASDAAREQTRPAPAIPDSADKAAESSTVRCAEEPSYPEKLPDTEAGQRMLADFTDLYETGEFEIGYCVAEVQVSSEGNVESIRVVRPRHADKRVEDVIVRWTSSSQYRPAMACGRPVAFDVTIGIGHCPAPIRWGRKSPG